MENSFEFQLLFDYYDESKYYSQSRRFFSSFIFLVCWECNFILFYVLCKKFFIWKIILLINFCMTRKPIQMYMRVQKLNKLFCRHENSWNVFFVEKYISINISNIWWTCHPFWVFISWIQVKNSSVSFLPDVKIFHKT